MNNGGANEFTSRRTNFLECEYWLVEKDNLQKDKSVLTHEKLPNGSFSAKIENTIENSSSIIGQTFLFDSKTLSISTTDYVDGLKRNCIVRCRGVIWRVESVNE